MMGQRAQGRLQKRLALETDWQPLLDIFSLQPESELIPRIARYLWQTPFANPPMAVLQAHTYGATKEQRIQSATLQLMATPEYQLC